MTTRSQTTIRVSSLENRSLTLSMNAAAVASAARREEGGELAGWMRCLVALVCERKAKKKKGCNSDSVQYVAFTVSRAVCV